MKKILLLSDTHGHLDAAILRYAAEADEIWHAGDIGTAEVYEKLAAIKPVRAVYGNIDGHELRSFIPEFNAFNCEGCRVLMVHIAGSAGKYTQPVKNAISAHNPAMLICGHSHILKVQRLTGAGGMLHVNPGAAGRHGFHRMRTMLRFVIHEGKPAQMEVIELGARSSLA